MRDEPGSGPSTTPADAVEQASSRETATDGDRLIAEVAARLGRPGLVVLTGVPGSGLTTALRKVAAAFRGPVFIGGGLAILRTTPGLALSRAVRARLPVNDQALTVEAVRSRVRGGLLIIDDLQWVDSLTLSALPAIATHCRVLAALRTPHPLPAEGERRLREAAVAWLPVPPLSQEAATDLARRVAPQLGPAAIADVVRRSGGLPLAVEALARHASSRRGGTTERATGNPNTPPVVYAVAEALADLTRPARTAMAALGMLGRPATRRILGAGVDELLGAGLVTLTGEEVSPTSPYVAEVAAGLLDADERAALHRRLAELVPDAEAARHLASAGDVEEAYTRAVAAAERATSVGERADLLLLACNLPGVTPHAEIRYAAAEAALAVGRPRSCLRVLGDETDPHSAVLRGEALLQAGRPQEAERAVVTVPDAAPADLVAARDRVRLLATLTDPDRGPVLAEEITARHGRPPAVPALRAALAAVDAARRAPGWEAGLATAAAAAGTGGDVLAARWSAWLLVETLASDGRLEEAAEWARRGADACAADLAYSWQTRFLAVELWCAALRSQNLDTVVRRAVDLVDRTLPTVARGYATAAASLAEADGGLLASARERLADRQAFPVSLARLLDWVAREAAWLDGQPERAVTSGEDSPELHKREDLIAGLRRITQWWAAHDGGAPSADEAPHHPLPPVRATLAAWQAVRADPSRAVEFDHAARAWHDVAWREEVRCLLARGLHTNDDPEAVPALLAAEQLAEQAGLVVLLGRIRRALRRHAVRRETRGPRAGTELTGRERDVLRLVARGEPTRRIAGLLGISRETVETHIRSGMRKMGARTRTEAAALALEVLE